MSNPIQPNPGISQSAQYAQGTPLSPGAAKHAAHTGLAIDALAGIGAIHWYQNRKRKQAGLPQEPMNKWAQVGFAGLFGYVFWWLPFALYMVLDVYVFQPLHLAPVGSLGILPIAATIAIMVFLWRANKRRLNRKYATYYEQKQPQPYRPVQQPGHAFMSDEWFQQANNHMRGR